MKADVDLLLTASLQWNINSLVSESTQAREDRKKRVCSVH